MSISSDDLRADRRRILAPLFAALLLTYAYGVQSPFNDNAVSRMALAICAATEGRLSIEPFQNATVDKAFHAGRFYSDKAPGLSIASLPVVAAFAAATGGATPADFVASPGAPGPSALNLRFAALVLFATFLVNGVVTALAACAVYGCVRRLGPGRGAALFAAVAFALGTPAWGWATAFFGHALAGGLALLAFARVVSLVDRGRTGIAAWASVGLLLGGAVLTEYPLVVPAAVIAAMGVIGARRRGGAVSAMLGTLAGAAGPAVVLLVYSRAVSGSWLTLSYEHVVGWEGMRQGFHGISYPRPHALWGILFSLKRGLFWLSPVTALVPIAFWRARRAMPSLYWGAALAIVVYFTLFNASYVYWDGGYSTGPRHLTPALAFACLPLAWIWPTERRHRAIISVLLAVSVLISGACAVTTMAAPLDFDWPLRDVVWPTLRAGEVSTIASVLSELFPAAPLPRGLASVVPLCVLWIVAAWQLRRGMGTGAPGRPPCGATAVD